MNNTVEISSFAIMDNTSEILGTRDGCVLAIAVARQLQDGAGEVRVNMTGMTTMSASAAAAFVDYLVSRFGVDVIARLAFSNVDIHVANALENAVQDIGHAATGT